MTALNGDSEVPDLDEFDVCDCPCPPPAVVLDTGRCSRCGIYVLPTPSMIQRTQEVTMTKTDQQYPHNPHTDGPVTVIGPECIASGDGEVLSWKGENYVKQAKVPASDEVESMSTYDEVVAQVVGDAADSAERLRLLVQEADRIARMGVNTPYDITPEHPKRLLACTSAAINLLYAIKTAGVTRA